MTAISWRNVARVFVQRRNVYRLKKSKCEERAQRYAHDDVVSEHWSNEAQKFEHSAEAVGYLWRELAQAMKERGQK